MRLSITNQTLGKALASIVLALENIVTEIE